MKRILFRTESTENKGVQAKENKNENVAEQIKNLKKPLGGSGGEGRVRRSRQDKGHDSNHGG